MAHKWEYGDVVTKDADKALRKCGVEKGTLSTADLLNALNIDAPDSHSDNTRTEEWR